MDREKVIKWLEYDYLPRVGAYRKDCKQGCDACMPMHDGDDYCDIDMLCKIFALLKEQEEQIENLKQTAQSMMEGVCLMKEQEDVQWINVKDKLPEKDGQYLVVYTFFDYRGMGIVGFSHNLHEIDEYIFNTESRPGWYQSDNEVGYYEKTTVTHWAKLPEFPKEGR